MNRRRAYLELHTAVLLFGFTAILGKLITLEEIALVWYRMGLATLSIFLIPGVLRNVRTLSPGQWRTLSGIGVIVALHWVTFFGSIKASSVSVTLSCMGTTALFTAFLEPLWLRRAFRAEEFALGLFIIPGIFLISRFAEHSQTGIILGIISAALASAFSILNKRALEKHPAFTITLVELGSGWLFLSLLLPLWMHWNPETVWVPVPIDWLWLLLLALVCTTLAYVLALRALGPLSAFINSLTINLEPVYGILLAMVIFQEHKALSPGFYAGSAMVLLAVFLHPWLSGYLDRKRQRSKA
ncbi:MAG: EamA family transporter [Bacteroidetes bacterium]|nr:EamA family transporter [Bacteroidota bacterium]